MYFDTHTHLDDEKFDQDRELVIENLKKEGIDLSGLKISPLASITIPYHIDIDGYSEDTAKGEAKIGTTKKGIGPTYTSGQPTRLRTHRPRGTPLPPQG